MTMSATAPARYAAPASDVSLFRLYALRGGYLLLVVGLGLDIWPDLLAHPLSWELMRGMTNCLLAGLCVTAILGLRYPLAMLPLLFFEITWKVIWLGLIALPLWRAHRIDADTAQTIFACSMVVIFPIIIPWRYVIANFARKPGDRWV